MSSPNSSSACVQREGQHGLRRHGAASLRLYIARASNHDTLEPLDCCKLMQMRGCVSLLAQVSLAIAVSVNRLLSRDAVFL